MVLETKRYHRRYLAKAYGLVGLSLFGLLALSQLKQQSDYFKETGIKGRNEFEEGAGYLTQPEIPFFLKQHQKSSFSDRRLKKVDADGSYDGKCTTLCSPTGGFLSLIGSISGQCDCVLWIGDDDEPYCKDGYENTCCGVLDNAGGVILYISVVFYSFLALAVICDNYFCESLSRISEALKLSDDVAGATFMAAGSSAPELFTSLVTVLITGGSEGLGTITGSAIFNMMIIVGATAFAACADGSDLPIWWYPLLRDSIMYFISTILMFIFMMDYKITWVEGLILVLVYGVYVYIMKRNTELAAWAQSIDKKRELDSFNAANNKANTVSNGLTGIEMGSRGNNGRDLESFRKAVNTSSENDEAKLKRYTAGNPLFRPEFRSSHGDEADLKRKLVERQAYKRDLGAAVATKRATEALLGVIGKEAKWPKGGVGVKPNLNGGLEFEAEEPPTTLDKVMDMISKPIECVFACSVPNCTQPQWENYYVLTFVMSILWIGILSFIMVDFSVRIGCNVGIPGLLMGLVFIAAGTSVPDALSSIAVGKSGMGDMAVANVLGSNIFNILLGLGLPWFMKAVISQKPYPLNKGEPIAVFILIMIMYLVGFLLIIQFNGWKLNIQLAKTFFGAHLAFVAFAVIVTFVDVGI